MYSATDEILFDLEDPILNDTYRIEEKSYTNLENLILPHCKIVLIDVNCFSKIKNLESLNLNFNILGNLAANTFSGNLNN